MIEDLTTKLLVISHIR